MPHPGPSPSPEDWPLILWGAERTEPPPHWLRPRAPGCPHHPLAQAHNMAQPLVTGTSRETGILSVSDLRLAGALGVSESHPSSEGSTLAPPPGKGSPSAKPGSRQTPTASPPSPGAPVPPMLCARRGHQNFPGPGPPPGPWRPARAMVRGPQDRSRGQGAGDVASANDGRMRF